MSDDNDTPASNLDALLEGWDKNKADEGNKELLSRVSKLEEENKDLREQSDVHHKALEAEAYKEDIKPVIATVKGETTAANKTVHNWLNGEADENPKLRSAWSDREKNPEAFDKMLEDLKPKFKEYIEAEAKSVLGVKAEDPPPDDPNEVEDTEKTKEAQALSHATRIARNANAVVSDDYEKVEWSALSDSAFAQMSEKVFADMRSGKLKPQAAA